jgi:hypothetical protein
LFVKSVVVFKIASLPRDYVHDHLLAGGLLHGVLDVDVGGRAPMETAQRF